MLRRPRPEEVDVQGFVMTPMIDIVFQLIIFFMLVLDLQQQQYEPVVLPEASEAVEKDDPDALVINVLSDGTTKIEGKKYAENALVGKFRLRRQLTRFQVPGDPEFVRYPVVIRADRSTSFEHLQKIMMIAVREGGVVELRFGAKIGGKP